MAKSIIVVSKPIQLVNVLNYLNQKSFNYANFELFVVDNFLGASKIADRINLYLNFSNVRLVPSYLNLIPIFLLKDIEGFYLDSDVGFINRVLILAANAENVSIFEEGIGTYTPKDFGPCGIIKTNLGGFSHTDNIVVYEPERIKSDLKHKVIKIKTSLRDFLEKKYKLLCKIFFNDDYDKKLDNLSGSIKIYFTSWFVDDTFISESDDDMIIRYHPHITKKGKTNIELNKYFLGELELLSLCFNDNIDLVKVYSHGTSTSYYLQEIKEIEFLQI